VEKSVGDTDLPSAYYIKNAYRETNTPNIVTVVLGDYRSIDTLGEEAVIFAAGMIGYLLLRREKNK
jgi:multisubunit Na+/H+ antiporter MnhB subunit